MFDIVRGITDNRNKEFPCPNVFIAVPRNSDLVVPKALTDFISIMLMKNTVFTAALPHTATVVSRLPPGNIFTVTGPANVSIAALL
jgi:hypothetical protein